MPLNNPQAGPNFTAEYSVSPIPWLTASTVVNTVKTHEFDYLTKYVTVKNTNNTSSTGDLDVAFTYNGFTTSHFIRLIPGESIDLDLRLRRIFVSSSVATSYTMLAGMTGIPSRMLPFITGSDGWQVG